MKQCAPFVLVMAALGGSCACSAGSDETTEQRAADSSDDSATREQEEAASDAPPPTPRGNSARSPEPEGEAPENADTTRNATTAAAACIPTSDVDLPDDDFVDADCDGIDGERDAAIFVSPAGFDEDPGTPDAPVRSLNRAVRLASETGSAVYVCNGTYRENLEITAPVAVYGGYDCSRAWQRIKDWAVVESGVGVQLSVRDVNGLVHIERMAFRASDATAYGQSSQAAAIVASTNVELVRVEFLTGDGAPGSNGVPGSVGTPAVGASANGVSTSPIVCDGGNPTALCNTHAFGGLDFDAEQRCSLGNVKATLGGSGGRAGNSFVMLGYPACAPYSVEAGSNGSAGQYLDNNGWHLVADADLGKPGTSGVDGAPASRGLGELQDGIYVASNSGRAGKPGNQGMPGRGGRGGDGIGGGGDICRAGFFPGSGGGQGGAGGCGGSAAMGGGGGGGSLGLSIVDSNASLSMPRFAIGRGGRGGDGARGGVGNTGKDPGSAGTAALDSVRGAAGEPGGIGGDGGDGGPGGGGPSLAILYSGTAPKVTDAVYDIGAPGDGGTSLSLSNASSGVTGEVVSLVEVAP